MHYSDSGIGIDSEMIPLFAGIGIRIRIKKNKKKKDVWTKLSHWKHNIFGGPRDRGHLELIMCRLFFICVCLHLDL